VAPPSAHAALLGRPSALGLAVPSAAAVPQDLGTRQTDDRDQMAPQRHPHLLAMAIALHRRKISADIRDLIRRVGLANPLSPRIQGELLNLGTEISQVTVGRYMPAEIQ
jgi:hypothetical protein